MSKNDTIGERSAKRLLPRAQRRRHDVRMTEVEDGRPFMIMAEVDDPMFMPAHDEQQTNTRRRISARNANESPLTLMEARGTINQLQAAAGLRFRILFERMMTSTPSPGDIKERVDSGTGAPDVMSAGRMQAGIDLRDAAKYLGQSKYWVVRTICGEGHSLREVAIMAGVRRDTVKAALRGGLDDLAEVWRLASKGHNRRAVA